MKSNKERLLFTIMLAAIAQGASAQGYPTKPVRLIVAFSPGGTPDVVARTVGEKMGQLLGQSFVVENKPGAGGMVAAPQVSKAQPDGYTLYMADIGQLAITPYLSAGKGFDPVKDFSPVGLAAVTPMFIVSNAKTTDIKTLQDLIREAKADPGKLNYGSAGVGSIHHVLMEVFKQRAGISVQHVPFKGSGQSVPALLAGDVQILVTAWPAMGAYAQSGQVNVLAATTAARYPGAPNVPAISESYAGYDFPSEVGLLAPPGTPPEIIKRLSDALKTALASPEVNTRFQALGSVPTWSSPADLATDLKKNIDKYGEAVRTSETKFE